MLPIYLYYPIADINITPTIFTYVWLLIWWHGTFFYPTCTYIHCISSTSLIPLPRQTPHNPTRPASPQTSPSLPLYHSSRPRPTPSHNPNAASRLAPNRLFFPTRPFPLNTTTRHRSRHLQDRNSQRHHNDSSSEMRDHRRRKGMDSKCTIGGRGGGDGGKDGRRDCWLKLGFCIVDGT